MIKTFIKRYFIFLLISCCSVGQAQQISFPYKDAGLTKEQAAAHLLDRFTFGATPETVQHVAEQGLEKWFQQQLVGTLPDHELTNRLSKYDALTLSNEEVVNRYPKNAQLKRMAIEAGVISKDSLSDLDKKEYKVAIEEFRKANGFKPERDLVRQFISQKIIRATYSENQLHEVLTDFWFNHFNVSFTKGNCSQFIPAYERDVIRPNVVGNFSTVLLATAKSPAMLIYLDNFMSVTANEDAMKKGKAKNQKGLNENYAREVMELHTLGVDGGYSQQDVTEAARILTGWTIAPLGKGKQAQMMMKVMNSRAANGKVENFMRDGDFVFVNNRHDQDDKMVLAKKFPAGGGYEEGVELLKLLANHPSTAHFISHKLAVRFVNDNPSESLVSKMAEAYTKSQGNISTVLTVMVSSPAFWSEAALREKTKSPFELTINAVRALHADVQQPYRLFDWMNKMGQKIYFYQAPTGFPDKGEYWINTSSLLNRMNFGLALANEKIQGIKIDLLALNNQHEPPSAEVALRTYSELLLPQRDVSKTIERLEPLVNDPKLERKISKAANEDTNAMDNNDADELITQEPEEKSEMESASAAYTLAQVVGIIIGSPEFQRR